MNITAPIWTSGNRKVASLEYKQRAREVRNLSCFGYKQLFRVPSVSFTLINGLDIIQIHDFHQAFEVRSKWLPSNPSKRSGHKTCSWSTYFPSVGFIFHNKIRIIFAFIPTQQCLFQPLLGFHLANSNLRTFMFFKTYMFYTKSAHEANLQTCSIVNAACWHLSLYILAHNDAF